MALKKALAGMACLGAAFLGGAVAQWVMSGRAAYAQEKAPAAQAAGAPVITAQAVRIVDAEGRERILLGVGPDGPGIVLKDAEDHPGIALSSTGGEEPYWLLAFMDKEGQDRFACGVRLDGKASGMNLTDAKGVMRVALGASEEGSGLALRNGDGAEVLGFGADPQGGGDFVLKHPFDEHEVWRASRTPQNPPEQAGPLPPP